MPTIVVIPAEILEAYTHPALDLVTGQIVELAPPEQVQLELFQEEAAPRICHENGIVCLV